MNNIYTQQDWERDGSLKVQVGQCIDDTVFENLLNAVPPTTYKSYCFQPGEAWSHYKGYPLYLTFVKANEGWMYKGLCFKGQNKPIQESKDFNGKIRLTESELHNLIKESVNHILKEEFYTKHQNPYDDTKKGNGQTKPLKDNIYLDSVRARIGNILQSINNNNIEAAKKQLLRLYKLVDAMINQA